MPTYEVCSEPNAQGEISIKWRQLKKSGKQERRHLFSVWRLQWATGSDQLFSCQSQSKSLRNHYPPPVQVMAEVHTLLSHSPGLQKVSKSITFDGQYCMGTRPCLSFKQVVSAKLPYRKSDGENVNAAHITKALAASQPIFRPKKPDFHPRARDYGTMTQSTLPPQSGTL